MVSGRILRECRWRCGHRFRKLDDEDNYRTSCGVRSTKMKTIGRQRLIGSRFKGRSILPFQF